MINRISGRDRDGRKYLSKRQAAPNIAVELDDGFTCTKRRRAQLQEDENGLFFTCRDGKHYLDGQLTDGSYYIGVYPI